MTLTGAIKELHELRSAEDMPIYYKPIIAEVINVLLMDTQEVKHGRWIWNERLGEWYCSNCDRIMNPYTVEKSEGLYEMAQPFYCGWCGARMDAQIGEDKSHPFAESVMMGMDGGENG